MPRRKTDYVNALTNAVYDDASEIKLTTHRTKRLLRRLVREAVTRSYVGDPFDATPEQQAEAKRIARELVP